MERNCKGEELSFCAKTSAVTGEAPGLEAGHTGKQLAESKAKGVLRGQEGQVGTSGHVGKEPKRLTPSFNPTPASSCRGKRTQERATGWTDDPSAPSGLAAPSHTAQHCADLGKALRWVYETCRLEF